MQIQLYSLNGTLISLTIHAFLFKWWVFSSCAVWETFENIKAGVSNVRPRGWVLPLETLYLALRLSQHHHHTLSATELCSHC